MFHIWFNVRVMGVKAPPESVARERLESRDPSLLGYFKTVTLGHPIARCVSRPTPLKP